MTRWEYRTEVGNQVLSDERLNALGRDGWELVSVAGRGEHKGLIYVFKREVS